MPSGQAQPIERLRSGVAPFVLYPLLALLTFPTLGLLAWGRDAIVYAHDVLDIPRSGVSGGWLPPLWNVHVGAGNAMLAQQAISPYAIDVPLGAVIGPFGAFAVNSWLLPVVAGLSMHAFLRDCLRLSTLAVVTGSMLYMFSYWQPVIGFEVPAVPLLLWLLDRAVTPSARRWRYAVAHTLVGAVVLYNGQSQIVALIAVLELAYVVLVLRGRAGIRTSLSCWAALWALSFLMYGPVLMTQLVALPLSQRLVWDLGQASIPSVVDSTIQLYASTLIAAPVLGWRSFDTIYGTFFTGVAGIPLLVAALVAPRDRLRTFVMALMLSIPVLDLLFTIAWPMQDQLGVLRSFQLHRVRHLYVFALVSTAALGLDVIVRAAGRLPLQVRLRWRWRVVAAAAAFAAAGTGVVIVAGLVGHRHQVRLLSTVGIGWVLMAVSFALGLAAVAWIVRWSLRAGRRTRSIPFVVAAVFLGMLLGERVSYAYGKVLLGPDLGTWRSSLDATPAQQFVLRQPGSGIDRILTFGDEPNRMGAVGLAQVDGYQAVYPLAYHSLFGGLIRPQLRTSPSLTTYFDAWGNRAMAFGPRVDPELVALVGARWLYVRNPPPPTFNSGLYRELPWTPSVPGLVARYRDAAVTVYEVPDVLPRAFVVGAVSVEDDDPGVVTALGRATLDELRGRAYVAKGPDADALLAATGADTPGRSAGTATIAEYTPDRVAIDVEADGPGVVILTDTWAPGWEAAVDGTAVPVRRVDEAFRGVAVTGGPHRVALSYRPWFTYAGFGLAAVGLGLWLALGLGLRWWDRRSFATAADSA